MSWKADSSRIASAGADNAIKVWNVETGEQHRTIQNYAKQVTSIIPIIFGPAGDPVGTGLVASLARPGGNVTGLSVQQTDLVGKRLEILREVIPGLRRLAIMAKGKMVACGTLPELKEEFKEDDLEELFFKLVGAEMD